VDNIHYRRMKKMFTEHEENVNVNKDMCRSTEALNMDTNHRSHDRISVGDIYVRHNGFPLFSLVESFRLTQFYWMPRIF
jgi:hypothetical protein